MDCSLPGSSIHRIFQAGVLEWGAIAFSEGSIGRFQFTGTTIVSPSRNRTQRHKDRKHKVARRHFQFSSVAQSCPNVCEPMNFSTPGLPVHQQLPEFTQTHVQGVSDAIQPSHSLSSPSPPDPNPSQHQSFPMSHFFASGGQSIGVSALASVLPKNTQD